MSKKFVDSETPQCAFLQADRNGDLIQISTAERAIPKGRYEHNHFALSLDTAEAFAKRILALVAK